MTRLAFILLPVVMIFLFSAKQSLAAEESSLTIKKNDALLEIARENHTTIEDLFTLNKMEQSVVVKEAPAYEVYKVKKGDTLYWLAKDFHTTVDALMEANNLHSSLILIGQELKIYQAKQDVKVKEARLTQTKAKTEKLPEEKKEENPGARTFTVTATAYTAQCDGCSGITYTGVNLLKDRQAKVIAVDPKVIPLGTKVYVEGYGYATAEDIGGAIKGNRIDIHLPTKKEAYAWGVREVSLTILPD